MADAMHSLANHVRWKLASAGGEWSGGAVSRALLTCPVMNPAAEISRAGCQLKIISAGMRFRPQASLNGRLRWHPTVRCSASEKSRNPQAADGEDMEEFLGGLSLEYDSVWDTKPAW